MDIEVKLDRFLKIKTNGRDDSNSNFINYPYEATPYTVLEYLANSGHILKQDKIIDYGCGKGRVSFFLAYSTRANVIGVEYNLRLYNSALDNHKKAISRNKVTFVLRDAADYKFPNDATGAYFFNPFSIDVLKAVINNILDSKKENDRDIKLFFYYPSKEYLGYLTNSEVITHIEDIDCMDIFKNGDLREVIKVYKI
ncbi:MAG: class I SAM-dependent methyltransferase [Anaeroplasmataceae bacterium]